MVYKQARIWSIWTVTDVEELRTSLLHNWEVYNNYATANAVLSLCSMNITKNHWVYISLHRHLEQKSLMSIVLIKLWTIFLLRCG